MKKLKIKNILLAAFAAAVCFFGSTVALCADAPVVSVSNAAGRAGDTVKLTVRLSGCEGFTSLALQIGYDKNFLQMAEEPTVNTAVGRVPTFPPTLTKNPFNLSWNGVNDITFNGKLVTLTFLIKETTPNGEYPVTISYFKGVTGDYVDGVDCNYSCPGSDATGQRLPLNLTYQDGTITVTDETLLYVTDIEKTDSTTSFYINSLGEETGKIIVAFYNGGALEDFGIYDAQKQIPVSYTGSYEDVKVMWWDTARIRPLTDFVTINQ